MAGNKAGGLKAAATNKKLYGEDFYKRLGHRGGSAWSDKPRGFAANPKLAQEVGRKIGLRTRKGYKWLGDVDSWHGRYKDKKTGEITVIKYSKEVK